MKTIDMLDVLREKYRANILRAETQMKTSGFIEGTFLEYEKEVFQNFVNELDQIADSLTERESND